MSDSATPDTIAALVERLAHGDRSTALAVHALLSAADDRGAAVFDRVAMAYRDDHLAALRAAGRDADREAGRLSLDEVREYLAHSLFPRLSGEGIVRLPPEGLIDPDATLRFTDAVWHDIVASRAELTAAMRQTGEQPAATGDNVAIPVGEHVVPGGSRLAAEGLVKVYRRRRVVNDVAVHLQQGEIVGLLGPNGAGKTTTFYMIVGLIQPLSGRILFDGADITNMPMYKRARLGIGYLSQEPSIFRKLSVEDNILAILQTLSISTADRERRLETLLDELGIKHLRKQKAYALSGGERRRLEITRALVTEPKFMMLDEPFAGVDPIAVHDIQTIVARLRNRNIGVLISDHNVEQTLDIVDRAYIMFDGQVKVSGSVRELV
ncbi:MAG: LPS export ABC transporter ATP-binding protein, partial [Gemmatimonadaceae bacterium]